MHLPIERLLRHTELPCDIGDRHAVSEAHAKEVDLERREIPRDTGNCASNVDASLLRFERRHMMVRSVRSDGVVLELQTTVAQPEMSVRQRQREPPQLALRLGALIA